MYARATVPASRGPRELHRIVTSHGRMSGKQAPRQRSSVAAGSGFRSRGHVYSGCMFPPTFDSDAHARRREKLTEAMRGQPFVLPSGKPRPRNYAANAYPFRAASHFLYAFGLSRPDALGHFDGERWTLHVPEPSLDDALWEGDALSLPAIEERLGVPVRPRAGLPSLRDGVATLPTPELETCLELEQL